MNDDRPSYHAGFQSESASLERWQAFQRAQVQRLVSMVLETDFDPVVLDRLQRVRSIR